MSTSAAFSGATYSRTASVNSLSEHVVTLDERDEPRARDRDELDPGVERAHELGVAPARDRRLGREEADAAIARREHGGVRLGGEHADHRDGQLSLKIGKRRRGRRVAGRHDKLHALRLQIARDLAREPTDLLERARAVGQARAVTEVDEVLVRKRDEALVQDGEAAHARVEDTDGAWIHARDSRSRPGARYPSTP